MNWHIILPFLLIAGVSLAIALRTGRYKTYYAGMLCAAAGTIIAAVYIFGDYSKHDYNTPAAKDFFLTLGLLFWICLSVLSFINLFLKGKPGFKIISWLIAIIGGIGILSALWLTYEFRHAGRFGCG